ncbi:LD-carboxypeptidase LdcB/DacB [Streptococcus merionis]|uniref:LD-carboxypeptidase LdcB/DacB n=1 Tax=Streptococcus merionis TaxID=400065 RepID=UPI0026EACED2|nr:LD-carboxypeptidase LdcB/DacB [Streptococcus merionis]
MKKYALVLLGLFALFLGACGQKAEQKNEPSAAVSSNQKKTVKTSDGQSNNHSTETSSSGSSTEEGGVTHNDIYFSVKNKYGDEIIIVNKKHPLSADYAPGENPSAVAAFHQLKADMQALGYPISDNYSGFRSYAYQATLYQSYVDRDGQAAADRYSARPGYSEHQSGLGFDLIDTSGNLLEDSASVDWLKAHAHEYGFVMRYLPGKEVITGYMPETWHIRYIGQEATDIYESGLTLEEYYGVEGGDYAD